MKIWSKIHIFFLHSTYSWGGDNLHATMLIIKKEDYVHTFNPKELRAYTWSYDLTDDLHSFNTIDKNHKIAICIVLCKFCMIIYTLIIIYAHQDWDKLLLNQSTSTKKTNCIKEEECIQRSQLFTGPPKPLEANLHFTQFHHRSWMHLPASNLASRSEWPRHNPQHTSSEIMAANSAFNRSACYHEHERKAK